jgi:2,3-bisphosphoglycerate-independent phosphoglycerate mutase
MVKKLVLCILDGFGYREEKDFNAVALGNTKNYYRFLNEYKNSLLVTHGVDVGLPEGQMGNSEVGHTNIGAGRVVYQELPKINKAILDCELQKNKHLIDCSIDSKNKNKAIHIMGLFSDGGVHSHINHFLFLAEFFGNLSNKVYLHLFTDGRDTPPMSAINYLPKLNDILGKLPNVKVATVMGRFYGMDRDKRMDRVEKAYNSIVLADCPKHNTLEKILKDSYDNKISDEHLLPVAMEDYSGMVDGDSVIMINFRGDRAIQILESLLDENYLGFERKKLINFSYKIGMVPYNDFLDTKMTTLFPRDNLINTMGEVLEKANLTQLRTAETEKFPHVTNFFSGGRQKPFVGETRILNPSPKVATYDLAPEMAANEIYSNLEKNLKEQHPDFALVNYANGDMVGHTGSLEASILATSTIDVILGKMENMVKELGYILVIIADHGNCETMWDYENNVVHTQHTTNLVKMIIINDDGKISNLENGILADVAPTCLELMGIEKPKEMTGKSLIKK